MAKRPLNKPKTNKNSTLQRVFGGVTGGDVMSYENRVRRSGGFQGANLQKPKRLNSGDPRMRGLEAIYMGKVPSSKDATLQRGLSHVGGQGPFEDLMAGPE
jgi:hypothetical protein